MPAIIALIPALVSVAEKLFFSKGSGQGSAKKEFVMGLLEKAWDAWGEKVFPDLPGFNEKNWFLGCCSVTVDEIVLALKAPK